MAQSVGDLDEFFRSVTDGTVEIVREGLRQHPEWANAELFSGIRPDRVSMFPLRWETWC